MPDLDNAQNLQYPSLEKMSTEELKQLLREDFESGDTAEDPTKDAFLACVAEVIAQREENDPDAPHFDADAGWKDFQEKYPVFRCGIGREGDEEQLTQESQRLKEKEQAALNSPQPESVRAGHRFRWTKLFALVAVIAVIGGCFLAVNGNNLFNVEGNATPDTFQFQSESGNFPQNAEPVGTVLSADETLQDFLAEQGITEPVCPKWVPTRYSLADLRSFPELKEPVFSALYEDKSGSNSIIDQVTVHRNVQALVMENDDINVSVYTVGSIEHHIVRNDDTLTATWFNENLECSLTGEISEEEMEAMINSIYEE